MLRKLAFRNAKRSIRDYGIYVLTITIIFSLIYAFNMIIFSKDILELSRMMDTLPFAIIAVSIVIVLVTGWLVHYMNKFMLQRRSREFGTYMLLGISNKVISKLFFLENTIMGFTSLLISLIVGTFFYQLLTAIIMNIFEASYKIKLSFSLKALGLTLLYIICIYLFSILRTKFILRKMKIYDLIYAEKKNETSKLKNNRGNWFIFILSIGIGVLGTVIMKWSGEITFSKILQIGLCYLLCIYGFYISLSSIIVKIFIHNKKLKYHKENLFLFRNLSAKINTMSITLGTLAMLLTLTLTSISMGAMFKGYFDEASKYNSPFDVTVSHHVSRLGTSKNFELYRDYLKNNYTIKEEVEYPVYLSSGKDISNLLTDTLLEAAYYGADTLMKYSDYTRLRKILGYEPVELKKGHFLLHCINGVKDIIDKRTDLSINIGSYDLKYQGSCLESFGLDGPNGFYYVVIVPDEAIAQLKVENMVYVANTEEETSFDTQNTLEELSRQDRVKDDDGYIYPNVSVRKARIEENRSILTIFTFSLDYIGLIFICIAATILAVQQISDSVNYQFRYRILNHLGMQRNRMDSLILKQFIFYFGLPVVLQILMSALIADSIMPIFSAFLSARYLFLSFCISTCLFLFVYALYFLATYIFYRKNVLLSTYNRNS